MSRSKEEMGSVKPPRTLSKEYLEYYSGTFGLADSLRSKVSNLQWLFLDLLKEELDRPEFNPFSEIKEVLNNFTVTDETTGKEVPFSSIHLDNIGKDPESQKQVDRIFKQVETALQTTYPSAPIASALFKVANQCHDVVYDQIGKITSPHISYDDSTEIMREYLCYVFDRTSQAKLDTLGVAPTGSKVPQGISDIRNIYENAASEQRGKSQLPLHDQNHTKELIREMSDADIKKLYNNVNNKIEENQERISKPSSHNRMLKFFGIRKEETVSEYKYLDDLAKATDRLVNPDKNLKTGETDKLVSTPPKK